MRKWLKYGHNDYENVQIMIDHIGNRKEQKEEMANIRIELVGYFHGCYSPKH